MKYENTSSRIVYVVHLDAVILFGVIRSFFLNNFI